MTLLQSKRGAMVLGVLLLLGAPAHAQRSKKTDPDEAKARVLFGEAQKSYDLGQFESALEQYSEAYKLKSLPGFLFNIAQCQRQLGNFKEAAFFYGRFIDNSKPEAANVELARQLLDESKKREAEKNLEAARKEEAARAEKAKSDVPLATSVGSLTPVDPPPSAPPLVVEEETPVYKKGWFWGAVGTAVVAGIVTGVVLGVTSAPVKTPTTLGDIDWRAR